MKTRVCRYWLFLCVMGCVSLFPFGGWATSAPIGVMEVVADGVRVERNGKKQIVRSNEAVHANDKISTDSNGKARVLLHGSLSIALGGNSTLVVGGDSLDKISGDTPFPLAMDRGVARIVVREGPVHGWRFFSITTPAAIIDLQGKAVGVEVSSSGVTDVTGLYLDPVFPVSVKNIHTGATDIIDKNGLAVKASQVGNTRYMAPAGKLFAIGEAVGLEMHGPENQDTVTGADTNAVDGTGHPKDDTPLGQEKKGNGISKAKDTPVAAMPEENP